MAGGSKGRQPRKSGAVAGVLSEITGSDLPRDFVSWHDVLPYRVWIHSRKSGGGYKPLSVELQWIGDGKLDITDEERSTRLKLAVVRRGESNDSSLGPSTFRGVPLGSLLEAHASLVLRQKLAKMQEQNKRPFNLVRDHELATYYESDLALVSGKRTKPEKELAGKEIGANLRDALVIAYVYAEQSAGGSKRPALLTAKLLNIKTNLVYVAVRIARKKGWLTESTSGAAGGVLTASGIKEFQRIEGRSLYQEFLARSLERKPE